MLEIQNLYKYFDDVHVLNGVNFHLEKGLVYTLKGGNGSGKTTLFNIISGFLSPTQGAVYFKEKKIIHFAPYKINRLGIGRTFQDLRLVTQMTVYENVLLAIEKKAFAYPTKLQKDKIDEILRKVSLSEKRDELAGEISYGQQKLLTIGCCIANNADLLLIDEPVAGIDKINQKIIAELICSLKNEGKTILQIEHNAAYIEETSNHVLHLEKGVIC